MFFERLRHFPGNGGCGEPSERPEVVLCSLHLWHLYRWKRCRIAREHPDLLRVLWQRVAISQLDRDAVSIHARLLLHKSPRRLHLHSPDMLLDCLDLGAGDLVLRHAARSNRERHHAVRVDRANHGLTNVRQLIEQYVTGSPLLPRLLPQELACQALDIVDPDILNVAHLRQRYRYAIADSADWRIKGHIAIGIVDVAGQHRPLRLRSLLQVLLDLRLEARPDLRDQVDNIGKGYRLLAGWDSRRTAQPARWPLLRRGFAIAEHIGGY